LTIYLFHLPLLVLFWDVLHTGPAVCLLAVSGSIIGLGYLTEHRRKHLRALLAIVAERGAAAGWGRAVPRSTTGVGVRHPTASPPVGLREAELPKAEITPHRLDTGAVECPPGGRVVS
jgi:hypothetical protein